MTIRLRVFLFVPPASLPAPGFLVLHVLNHRADEIAEALHGALQLTAGLYSRMPKNEVRRALHAGPESGKPA